MSPERRSNTDVSPTSHWWSVRPVLRIAPRGRGCSHREVAVARLDGVRGEAQRQRSPRRRFATFATPILAFGDSTTLTLRANANVLADRYPLRGNGHARVEPLCRHALGELAVARLNDGAGLAQQPTCGTANLSGLTSRIYVAPGGSDSPACGRSTTSACASIQQGIDNCPAAGCGVLVRHGQYKTTATITLRDGVSVYGRFHSSGVPTADPAAANYRTLIVANPPPGGPAVSGESINTPTVVSGLAVWSRVGQPLSAPSIVMAVSNSKGMTLARSSLMAGAAIAGGFPDPTPAGGPGGTGSSPSQATTGGPGGVACALQSNPWSRLWRTRRRPPATSRRTAVC